MATNIASLPVELLIEIFVSAQVHNQHFAERDQVEGNAQVAIAVSQVCHQWREAALGFSALWVYIAWGTYLEQRLPLISRQIERSKGRPLIFHILHPLDVHTQVLVRKTIKGHFPNAAQITVQQCTRDMLATILRHSAPQLRSLRVHASSTIRLTSAKSPRVAKEFKALKYLHLETLDYDIEFAILIFQAELIKLDNVQFPVRALLGPSASTLTTLTLSSEISVLDADIENPLVLPALQKLSIYLWIRDSNVVLAMSTPHLKSLQLVAADTKDLWPFFIFLPHNWSSRPLMELEELVIDFASVHGEMEVVQHPGVLERMFSVFSNVRDIRLKGSSGKGFVEYWGREAACKFGADGSTLR